VIKQNLEELIKGEAILRDVVMEMELYKEIPKNYELLPWYLRFYKQTKDWAKNFVYDAWDVLKYGRVIEEEPIPGAIKGLRRNVFLIDKTSYIFYVVVRDNYPRRGAAIADAIARHLVDYLRDEQRSKGQAKQAQLKALMLSKQKEIEGYRREIQLLLTANDVVSPSLEAEQAMARWSELDLSRVQLESQIAETRARLADAREISEGNTARRRDNLGQDGDARPGSPGLIQPSDLKKLESDRLFTEIELSGLTARYDAVTRAIAEVEHQRQILPGLEKSLSDLKTRLEVAQRDYVQFTDAYQEAVVQATGEASEAEVLAPAAVPSAPVAPIKVYHVGLAGFLALVIAIGLIYLFTFADIYVLFPPKPIAGLPGLRTSSAVPGP
jgi:uncharacterized protein involved in exopolysaccharide biosynthesis